MATSRFCTRDSWGTRVCIRGLVVALLHAFCAVIPTGFAQAESSVRLPYPAESGIVAAVTFDSESMPVGRSEFASETRADGRVFLKVAMRVSAGAENRFEAVLEPVESVESAEDTRARQAATGEEAGRPAPLLRIAHQRSQSFDAAGNPMTLLEIDHAARKASCTPPGAGPEETTVLRLPEPDRVVNVPLNLLFIPLVAGEVDRVKFQFFVCRGGPKLWDFVALRAGPARAVGRRRIVEVRYGPDLGRMVSWVASRLLPKLSFWLDASDGGAYMGHRMPLYSDGPDLVMLREDLSPQRLDIDF